VRKALIEVALGMVPADLVLKGGKLVNVLTGEIYGADVAVKGEHIACVGQVDHTIGPQTEVVDAGGMYLTPGLIDQHVHTYESQLSVPQYAAAVLPRGTTAITTDFYGESTVGGKPAVRFSLDIAKSTPLKVLFVLGVPGYYQNVPFGHSGVPTAQDMMEMLDWPECVGINDTFASKIIEEDPFLLELIQATQAKGKKVCGHGSEISGRALNAWVACVRNTDDHECVDPLEALEKARSGVWVSMREGSGCPNVADLCKAIAEYGADARRFTFNTDLRSPMDIVREGHIDNAIRTAIRQGVHPVTAVQIATINAAECVKVSDDLGSITPGKYADILLVRDLPRFDVKVVIANGRVVARDGRMVVPLPPSHYPPFAYNTVRLPRALGPEDLEIRVGGERGEVKVRVIVASGDSLITEETHEMLTVRDGRLQPDVDRDILKIVSIERHHASGEMGKGFIKGFGLKDGAIASTYNPQHQNLQVVGANDRDMAVAANELARIGGGFVAVRGGQVVARLELPLFGLLSDEPLETVVQKYDRIYAAVAGMGSPLPAPFHTLAFVGLPITIGKLKISPKGLVDVWQEREVDLIVD